MSDIPVVEIIAPSSSREKAQFEELLKQQKADAAWDAKHTKPVEVEQEVPAPAEEKTFHKWVRTRHCWCPRDAHTDCRFHSMKEPGWEICPSKNSPARTEGRWLWASIGKPDTDESDDEVANEVAAGTILGAT